MKIILVLPAMVALAVAQRPLVFTKPYDGSTAADCEDEGKMFVDAANMCWFHKCVRNDKGGFNLQPVNCALGSKISYNFISGFSNPCTVNFDSVYGYDCKRTKPSLNGPPDCFPSTVCQNGGTPLYESDHCWCACPPSWQGEFDCSLPTRVADLANLPPASNICVDGNPIDDWCNKPAGRCLNGGTCFNLCDTFWCNCPDKEYNIYLGKRCELV